jgi:hypothetical protein
MIEAEEYFSRDEEGAFLMSNGIKYRVRFTKIDGIDYFYQYPTEEEISKGIEVKRRLASEISNFQTE